ncbi:uncharacterized protein LOC115999904 [Ipomoea triloba]|uniref:uncharacterized protein LOC115999904 n=1 Tax=Ipomoea triloba TaxID=35885 RepID=UPI00125CFD30|nr:uncharacterized protein LOC115999904 [Ipomoea triloba]
MADIAILVAEEYERRIKNARKLGSSEGEVIELLSVFKGQKLEGSSSSLVKVKLSGGEEKRLEVMMMKKKNKVLQPHFEVGVAARNGFFSA